MSELVVYTRPGCPFCTLLRTRMSKRGLQWREVNIWQDPEAAAAVRAAANGNETVPTVNVGSTWLVNPSLPDLLEALENAAPELVPPQPPGLLDKLGLRKG
jgi:mycoredoxin